jgi:hypothetical protein
MLCGVIVLANGYFMDRRRPMIWSDLLLGMRAIGGALLAGGLALGGLLAPAEPASAAETTMSAAEGQVWTCGYIASTPRGPLQITAKFRITGQEMVEVETIPRELNFSERYTILEDNGNDIVAAISIAKISANSPPGIGAVIIIIAKQNGLFQQSGAILGLQTGAPTLGHCDSSTPQ